MGRVLALVLAVLFVAAQIAAGDVCRCSHDGPCRSGTRKASPSPEAPSGGVRHCCRRSPPARESRSTDAPTDEPCRGCGCVSKDPCVTASRVSLPSDSGDRVAPPLAAAPASALDVLALAVTAHGGAPPGRCVGPPSVPSSDSPSLLPVRLN